MTAEVTLGAIPLVVNGDNGYLVEIIDGWGSPASTISVQRNARADGGWASESYLAPKSMSMLGHVLGDSDRSAVILMDALEAAASLGSTDLTVTEGGFTRSLTVRRGPDVIGRTVLGNGKTIRFSIPLVAVDPRKTSTALTATTGLPASTGGWTFPLTLPAPINAVSSSGRITLVNDGNTTGKVTIRITAGVGGITGPRVTHVASGKSLVFATSLTIAEDNWVDVDMEAHTVLENGTASRNGWVTGRGWSGFAPGDNQWVFGAVSGLGTLSVTATPSWM